MYDLLDKLASCHELTSRQELFARYTHGVLSGLQSGYAHWTQLSVERHVFDTLLMESGENRETFKTHRATAAHKFKTLE